MKKKIGQLGLFLMLSFLVSYQSLSQGSFSLEGFDLSGDLESWYDREIGLKNTVLQTGSLMDFSVKSRKSHPYFNTKFWVKGDLVYQGQSFESIPMIYNIEEDALVIQEVVYEHSGRPIKLISNQVSEFTLEGRTFKFIKESIGPFEEGFFEMLYEGEEISLLAKRTKLLEINSTGELEYEEKDRYYLKKGNNYHTIYRKSSLIRLFKTHEKDIRLFIRKNNIEILKVETDFQFATLVQYCGSLIE